MVYGFIYITHVYHYVTWTFTRFTVYPAPHVTRPGWCLAVTGCLRSRLRTGLLHTLVGSPHTTFGRVPVCGAFAPVAVGRCRRLTGLPAGTFTLPDGVHTVTPRTALRSGSLPLPPPYACLYYALHTPHSWCTHTLFYFIPCSSSYMATQLFTFPILHYALKNWMVVLLQVAGLRVALRCVCARCYARLRTGRAPRGFTHPPSSRPLPRCHVAIELRANAVSRCYPCHPRCYRFTFYRALWIRVTLPVPHTLIGLPERCGCARCTVKTPPRCSCSYGCRC